MYTYCTYMYGQIVITDVWHVHTLEKYSKFGTVAGAYTTVCHATLDCAPNKTPWCAGV